MAQLRKYQMFMYLESRQRRHRRRCGLSLLLEAVLLNLSLCRRHAAVWSEGFSPRSQVIGSKG